MISELSKKDLSHLVKSKITASILEITNGAVLAKNLQKAIKKGVKLITAELHKNLKDIKAPAKSEPAPEPVQKANTAGKTIKAGIAKSADKKGTTPKKAVKKASIAKKTVKKGTVAKKAIKKTPVTQTAAASSTSVENVNPS